MQTPSERWSNTAGWSIELPVGWERDDDADGDAEGFVPPARVGRLSVFTLQSREEVAITDSLAREQADSFASVLGIGRRIWSRTPREVEHIAPDHLAVTIRGKARGRHTVAVVHVFPPGLIVCAAWHTPDNEDVDSTDGVAAARSVAAID